MEMEIDTSHYGNGVSPSIPVSIWGSKWSRYPFLYGDPRIETGPRFRMGTIQSLTRFQIEFMPIWGLRYSIRGSPFPYGDYRTERAGRLEYSHMGNSHFRIEFVSIWGSVADIIGWYVDSEIPATSNRPSRFVYGSSQKLCHFSETTYQPIVAVTDHGTLNGQNT